MYEFFHHQRSHEYLRAQQLVKSGGNLRDIHQEIFREQIEHRLDSEFRHCRTLGKELIR